MNRTEDAYGEDVRFSMPDTPPVVTWNPCLLQVGEAVQIFGNAWLRNHPEMVAALQSGALSRSAWFDDLRRMMFRLVLVLIAEECELLLDPHADHEARQRYLNEVSMQSLRQACLAPQEHPGPALHERVKRVLRALHAGDPSLGLPALGGPFANDDLPCFGQTTLPDADFIAAFRKLVWSSNVNRPTPISWGGLEPEGLAHLFGSLLAIRAQWNPDGSSFELQGLVDDPRSLSEYFIPEALVENLLDTVLEPVLSAAVADSNDPVMALLQVRVLWSFPESRCSSHRLPNRLAAMPFWPQA